MPLIDDDGNLFGVVNVIDALAVALVIAVLVAGVAFVGVLGADSEPETRYATVDLGPQPDYVADQIDEGDTTIVDGHGHNATVTDVYVTPAIDPENSTQSHVTVRTAVNGELVYDDTRDQHVFEYAGERLRSGSSLTLDTDDYVADGEVTNLDPDGTSLPVTKTEVLIDANVTDSTASEIDVGDTIQAGSHTVATVTDVQLYPDSTDRQRALVGLELVTLDRGSTPTFGSQSVSVGRELHLAPGNYELTGEVVRRGATTEPGEPMATVVDVDLENVRPSVADGLEVGMTETVRGETLATIRSIDREPAQVVIETEDGNVHFQEHPVNEDVTLTVELESRQTESGLRFHGESLREGTTITLDFGTQFVEGEVTRIR